MQPVSEEVGNAHNVHRRAAAPSSHLQIPTTTMICCLRDTKYMETNI